MSGDGAAATGDGALRLGVLGCAAIAREFVARVAGARGVRVVAVASREPARARAFAAELGVPRALDSYDALVDDPDVDAVYVPLPNTLHATWSMRAARAGKHVLCEKPLAMTAAEAREVFAVARAAGVHVVEAFPYRMQPQTLALRQLVRSGGLGALQLITASFGFPLRDPGDIRYQPALGGGALYDAGSYPVSLVRMLAGERPQRAFAIARWADAPRAGAEEMRASPADASAPDPRIARGVDTTLAGTFAFASGLLAQITCTFHATLHRAALVVGADGVAETAFYNHPPAGRATIAVRRGPARSYDQEQIVTEARDGFVAELEGFAQLIRDGAAAWPGVTPAESIDTAAMLEALHASARTGAPVDLPPA